MSNQNDYNCGKVETVLDKNCDHCLVECKDPTPILVPNNTQEYEANESTTQVANKYNPITGIHLSGNPKKCCVKMSVVEAPNPYTRTMSVYGAIVNPAEYCPSKCDMDRFELSKFPNTEMIMKPIPVLYLNEADAKLGIIVKIKKDAQGNPVLNPISGQPIALLNTSGEVIREVANPMLVVAVGQAYSTLVSFVTGALPTEACVTSHTISILQDIKAPVMEPCEDECNTCK